MMSYRPSSGTDWRCARFSDTQSFPASNAAVTESANSSNGLRGGSMTKLLRYVGQLSGGDLAVYLLVCILAGLVFGILLGRIL